MKRFWLENVREIASDRALKYYGAALALTHVLTFFWWSVPINRWLYFAQSGLQVCWPYYPSCAEHLISGAWLYYVILAIYLLFAIADALLFLFTIWTGWAFSFSLFLMVFKLLLVAQDYRFMGNYHYMVVWVQFAFLFIPNKRLVLRWLLPLFYVAAGILKFNTEWLSGQALITPLPVPPKVQEVLCSFVPILEIGLVWGLLAENLTWFTAILSLFLIFHLISFWVVGWFYPAIMLLLLSILLLTRLMKGGCTVKWTLAPRAYLGIFLAAQSVPWFYRGDSALTGQGRILSMNMLDASALCDVFIFVKTKKGLIVETERKDEHHAVRVRCDPIVVLAEAKRLCETKNVSADFLDVDLGLVSRRKTDRRDQSILALRDICRNNSQIGLLGGLPR